MNPDGLPKVAVWLITYHVSLIASLPQRTPRRQCRWNRRWTQMNGDNLFSDTDLRRWTGIKIVNSQSSIISAKAQPGPAGSDGV